MTAIPSPPPPCPPRPPVAARRAAWPPARFRRLLRTRLLTGVVGAGLALGLGLGVAASAALPAQALSAVAHGIGFSSAGDGRWLGSYRLDDGRLGFCIDVGLAAPPGHDYSPIADEGRSPDDRARLAYISRRWAGADDPVIAAAGQLATWSITGLGGHDLDWYARRAGDRASDVEDRARAMLAEADGPLGASRSVSATAAVHLGDDGRGTVRVDLRADFLATGPAPLPAGSETGSVTLTGGTFADGTTTARIANGTEASITATGAGPELHAVASASFTGLPFGDGLDVVGDGGASQPMILSRRADATASAEGDARAPSPLPFAPQVSTRTSRAVAAAGDPLTDALHVTAAPAAVGSQGAAPMTDGWGLVRRSDGSLGPVPVTVRSRLLGPFREQVGPEREGIPDHAPLVCEVSTRIDHGPGDYTSPPCTLPAGGFYTWVETISPADTPADQGRSRVLPWTSTFGAATETTQVPRPPTITTTISAGTAASGDCLSDTLHVSAFVGTSPIPVRVHLVGPLAQRPADGSAVAVPGGSSDDALTASLSLAGDGDATTPCVHVDEPGWYVAVLDSPGRAAGEADGAAIPAFADHVAHASEMTYVAPPPTAATPPAPARLAVTGGSAGITLPVRLDAGQLSVAALTATALGALCLGLVRAGRRRIRARASRWARS